MNDLDLVAGLRAGLPEPPSARLAVGRARLTAAIRSGNKPVTARSRRMRVNRTAVAICLGAVAAAAAAALVLTGGPGAVPSQHLTAGSSRTVVTAAWTVREDANGTVTIYLREYANPAGLQQTLRADGVNAIVRPMPSHTATGPRGLPVSRKLPLPTVTSCYYATTNNAPPAVQRAVVTIVFQDFPTGRGGAMRVATFVIHPHAMPPGSALFLPYGTHSLAPPINGYPRVKALWPVVLKNNTVPACVPVIK
jgi:hypothetical protein